MNNHFNELLDQFLDDAISDVNETTMFSMINSDSDLRQQFVTALRVRSTAPSLATRTMPSPEMTSRILAATSTGSAASGSAASGSAASGSAASGSAASGSAFWAPRLLAPLGALLLSGALFLSGFASGARMHDAEVTEKTVADAAMSDTAMSDDAVADAAMSDDAVSEVTVRTPSQTNAAGSAVIPSNEADEPRDNLTTITQTSGRAEDGYTMPTILRSEPVHHEEVRTLDNAAFEGTSRSTSTTRFNISLRTLNTLGMSSAGVASNDNSGFNDLAIDATMKVTDWMDLGIEVGRQSYLQTYQRTIGNVTEEVKQFPALWWSGPTARFTGRNLIAEGVSPFTQTVVGLSDGGVIARALAGIEWRPASMVSIQGAMECSNLWYTASGITQSSLQYNWSLGVGILW